MIDSTTLPANNSTVGQYSAPATAPVIPVGAKAGTTPDMTPVSDPPATNPIATSGVTRYTGAPSTPMDSNQTGNYKGQDGNYYDKATGNIVNVAPADNESLRNSELAGVQGKIDAINSDYATNLTQINQNNANLTGGTRASDAARGLLGSDFGIADEAGAANKATANVKALQDKKNSQLNSIYDSIQKDIDAKQAAFDAQQGKITSDQQAGLKKNSENYIVNLAKTGGSLESLSENEYSHIKQVTGMSDSEIKAMYVANVPPEKVLHSSVQNGQYIQVTRDPVTGKVETNTIPITGVPEGYTYNSSLQAFVPKIGVDPNKPVSGQIIPYAKAVTPKSTSTKAVKPIVGAPKGFTQDIIQKGSDALEVNKGADHYVDPYFYQHVYQGWIDKGGSVAGFIKTYPPKNYINPDDNKLLPSYLQTSSAKKTSSSSSRTL